MGPKGLASVLWSVCACALALAAAGVCGCATAEAQSMDVSEIPGAMNPTDRFAEYYKPVQMDIQARMPSYDLPLDLDKVTNLEKIRGLYLRDDADLELLVRNGFVVTDGGAADDVVKAYDGLRTQDVPIFVTADTLLHLYHIQFDETLKEIEENEFYPDVLKLTKAMLAAAEADYKVYDGDLKEAAKRNVAYFVVALKQFEGDAAAPAYVKDWVDWECDRIEKHKGLPDYEEAREKALFRYPEDYSQYKPRGHYTRSETLQKYFRGMMWYGRQTFLLKGSEKFGPLIPPAEALVDGETARIQTLQSALISAAAGNVKVDQTRTVAEVWDRIYAVTAYYVGLADDLTIYEYRDALREVFGVKVTPEDLARQEKLTEYVLALTRLRRPAIFSGSGGAGFDPGCVSGGHEKVSIEQLKDILDSAQGLRLMGQRYVPDSYILGQVVSPGAGIVPRRIPERFTAVYISDGRVPGGICTIRGFPRGLDVFSVLGSERAAAIIESEKDHEYPKYLEQVEKLKAQFAAITDRDWNRNLYWSWLYCLKALVEPRGEGYQSFQRLDAWTDRQLASALASWASLRHDTILYAKQSYTVSVVEALASPPPPPKGLVEPAPEFFARILATTRMTTSGLSDLNVLSGPAGNRLRSLEAMMTRLYDIVKSQVANKGLSQRNDSFLSSVPASLKGIIGRVEDEGLKTSLIADVHTDLNTLKCLEEASGHVDYLVVAYKRPEGDIVLAVGPVFSYYEFKHPVADRLTDEQWRKMLSDGSNPERPQWTSSFTRLKK